jgi:hypothetical protein
VIGRTSALLNPDRQDGVGFKHIWLGVTTPEREGFSRKAPIARGLRHIDTKIIQLSP